MSKIKKILAVVLAMAMVLMMSMSVFATPVAVTTDKATVTINGLADDTNSVTLYKVAGATKDDVTGAVVYSLEPWALTALTALGYADEEAALTALGYAEGSSGVQAPADHAGLPALVAADKTGSTPYDMDITTSGDSKTATAEVEVGIYVAVTAGGATIYAPMMVSVNYEYGADGSRDDDLVGSTTTAKKIQGPDFTKTADEDRASVKVGGEVHYTISTRIPNYDSSYTSAIFKVSDTLTHLDLNTESIVVKVNDVELTKDTDYTQSATTKGFTVDFKSDYVLNNPNNIERDVIITYTATVNEDAQADGKVLPSGTARNNTATLTYSTDPNGGESTKTDDTNHYTFNIDGVLTKVDGDSEPLSGAEFTIYTANPDGTKAVYTNGFHEDGKAVSDDDGNILFQGLPEGTYFVKETSAPEGFSLNETEYEVVITADLSDEILNGYTITVDGQASASIVNTKLASLPSTGGIGTTIFTVVGCVLMIAAAAMFFVSRRKAED